jgi:phosphotransferase system HPr-like phosphotransfer protein
MRSAKYFLKLVAGALFLYLAVFPISSLMAAEEAPSLPKFSLNGKPVTLTVQDLSGFGTRPLRLLVQRNNRAHHEELIQVYALGVSEGDDLKIQLATPLAGIRATVYKILHAPDGERFLSMPASVYFEKPGQTDYAEKIGPFHRF